VLSALREKGILGGLGHRLFSYSTPTGGLGLVPFDLGMAEPIASTDLSAKEGRRLLSRRPPGEPVRPPGGPWVPGSGLHPRARIGTIRLRSWIRLRSGSGLHTFTLGSELYTLALGSGLCAFTPLNQDSTPSLLDQDRRPSPSDRNVFELWRRTTAIERAVVLPMGGAIRAELIR